MKKTFLVIIAYLSLILPAYCYTGDIERIDGRKYFPAVKKLISEAKKCIHIVMYIATYNPYKPSSSSNQLLSELAAAQERDVEVKVILDQERPHSVRGHYNDPGYFFLKNSGCQVAYEEPSRKTHPKLIIIDEKIVVIGSHNWSDSAFKKNRETSVILRCPEAARGYIEYFNKIPVYPRTIPPPQSKSSNIYMPYQFLTNPNLGIKLHGKRLTFYLYLLKKWEESGQKPFYLNYKNAAIFLGWDEHSRRTYRILINDALRMFHKHFNLILYKPKRGKSPEIELLDYKNASKPLILKPFDCFVIPGTFWEFGWVQKLSRKAKYFYLVNLLETSRTQDPHGFWKCDHEYLYKKYHLNSRILPEAIEELRRYNLLKVVYSPFREQSTKHTDSNKYLLLPLYSQKWLEKEQNKLAEIYGKDKLAQARNWASVILEENNPLVIEKLISYANQYGEAIVQYAIDQVSGNKLDSPRRCFPYVEGIIFNKNQEKIYSTK